MLDGRRLRFHLTGINNQNFLMRDEETGSWWQQITGCAILGPLAGRCLDSIPWDEITFAVWKGEHPDTEVLRAAEAMKEDYAPADWEKEIDEYPTVLPVDPHDSLKPRDLVVGLKTAGVSKAYPWTALTAQGPVIDVFGDTPVLSLVHADGRSVRCFDRRVEGRPVERFL